MTEVLVVDAKDRGTAVEIQQEELIEPAGGRAAALQGAPQGVVNRCGVEGVEVLQIPVGKPDGIGIGYGAVGQRLIAEGVVAVQVVTAFVLRQWPALRPAVEGVLTVDDDAMGGPDRSLEFGNRLLPGIGDVHAATEVTPAPGDRVLHGEPMLCGDAEEGEVDLAGEWAGVERSGIAADAQDVLMRLALTIDAAVTFDAFEGVEPLGVQGKERQPKEIGLGFDGVGGRPGRRTFLPHVEVLLADLFFHTHHCPAWYGKALPSRQKCRCVRRS